MDAVDRPDASDVSERLRSKLVAVDDVDALARTLLTGLRQPGALPHLRGAALGLVEGAGRRMRVIFSDDDLEGTEPPLGWTLIDGYDDVPFNDVIRTGQPVLGDSDSLEERYFDFVQARRARGTRSLAVLPLGHGLGAPREGEAEVPADRPMGALLLCYDEVHGFDPEEQHALAEIAVVVGDALERLATRLGPDSLVLTEPRGDGAAETTLPNDERAPSTARRFLRDRLRAWAVSEEAAATAELCLSEVVTNAVIHAGSSSRLVVALIDGALEVRVRDKGGRPHAHEIVSPTHDPGDPLRVHGRGLMLVDALSSGWGAEAQEDGTSVWFTLALDDVF